jgi:hypothetical protein
MYEPLHLSGADYLVPSRIADLRLAACETRGTRREPAGHDGVLTRTRAFLGRRLISLGTTVAGNGA